MEKEREERKGEGERRERSINEERIGKIGKRTRQVKKIKNI